ncbi:amino acid aminotransferase [Derxia gummosa]|uniref:Aminotransferase n=1 Tax=Derxia gummosa DSM 723 TaxID=1121388 RepID=A0A8B6X7S4_9BURK|nr:amino acid aminotransferase [Derxia gummosa]
MSASLFAAIDLAPRDPILGLNEAFAADKRDTKVNLGVGVYYDDAGKIPLLAAVREAEKLRFEQAAARGYLPIEGIAAYDAAVGKLLFGAESPIVTEGRLVTAQALGGTGALKIGADFLKRYFPASKVLISNPSWENHRALFESAGFEVGTYAYYVSPTDGANVAGMLADLKAAAPQTIVVLHACCHNPTGVDLTADDWKQVVEVVKERNLIAFLDIAYQGFGDGIDADAVAVRLFADAGISFLVSSSFSKSFSLYGERVGALTVVDGSKDESARVLSQLKRVIRTNYSNPPTHGGTVVASVLNTPELRKLWEDELAGMRDRIKTMRAGLAEGLGEKFAFVTRQRGMFSYTGLSAAQVERLKEEFGIYAVSSGRICVAALNSKNLGYVVDAIGKVVA